MKTLEKILIANRGEIAVRIIRSARKLGLRTVSIYTTIEENALHVNMADEAWCLGEGSLSETYLNIAKIIGIAKKAQCDCIHPGYGFLAENALFAETCEAEGITFIGPGPDAIRLMGHKIEARNFAVNNGLPVAAGAAGDLENLLTASTGIPFPILVKAAAGGGGKGMRIVRERDELRAALEATSREAKTYFGDGSVYLEQYIENPRHIEVQILGDKHGNVVHLFERECSIQRRYQKIIEESPSPTLTPEVRERICMAAVKLGQAANYSNAGTIEFLVDSQLNFYFLEMNTRIQVEHPVTEMVTGIDIVEEQISIAAGFPLRYKQDDICQKGHAIECRIYAEDPENNFMPSPGKINLYQEPEGPGIRIDTGIDGPVIIRPDFDPMIAKIISHGSNRELARQKMISAINHYPVLGIKTNTNYLLTMLSLDDFIANTISTKFCDAKTPEILEISRQKKEAVDETLPLMAFLLFSLQQTNQEENNIWNEIGYWRNDMQLKVIIDGKPHQAELKHRYHQHYHFGYNNQDFKMMLQNASGGKIEFFLNDVHYVAYAATATNGTTQLQMEGFNFSCDRKDMLVEQELLSLAGYGHGASEDRITSPMPGKIVKVNVAPGDSVTKGTILLIVEAMKMENNIVAMKDGEIDQVNAKTGETVDTNTELITFK
jgi:acetyl-CoA carboxylase biotin carboxylase subunit